VELAEYIKHDLVHIRLENEHIRAVFLPEIGGKMIELTNKNTGRQFLLEPQQNGHLYKRPNYGDSFENYDTSGFDECFPTVEASELPEMENCCPDPLIIPDHGELWSIPWEYEIDNPRLRLSATGKVIKYRFDKSIHLLKNRIHFKYQVENQGDFPFHYLWSAHPLLKVVPGAQLILPKEIENVFLNWASHDAIGKFGDCLTWPHLNREKENDYSLVPHRKHGEALKCFTDKLENGYAGIHFPETRDSLLFEFDVNMNPYLGIWLCYGGWPEDQENKHLTVALEPSSGRPDSLAKAIEMNESSVLKIKETKTWDMSISLWEGLPSHLATKE
jgi:hypothetical protein